MQEVDFLSKGQQRCIAEGCVCFSPDGRAYEENTLVERSPREQVQQ